MPRVRLTWSSFPSFPVAEDEINFARLKRKVRSSFASNFCTAFPFLRSITPPRQPLQLLLALIPMIPSRSRDFVPRLIEFLCSFRSPEPIWRSTVGRHFVWTSSDRCKMADTVWIRNSSILSFVYCLVLSVWWWLYIK